MCTAARQQRELEAMEKRLRADLVTLTDMIFALRSPPLEELRGDLETYILAIVVRKREHKEHFADDERTPMPRRTPSQEMVAVRGLGQRTTDIFEDAKRKP